MTENAKTTFGGQIFMALSKAVAAGAVVFAFWFFMTVFAGPIPVIQEIKIWIGGGTLPLPLAYNRWLDVPFAAILMGGQSLFLPWLNSKKELWQDSCFNDNLRKMLLLNMGLACLICLVTLLMGTLWFGVVMGLVYGLIYGMLMGINYKDILNDLSSVPATALGVGVPFALFIMLSFGIKYGLGIGMVVGMGLLHTCVLIFTLSIGLGIALNILIKFIVSNILGNIARSNNV